MNERESAIGARVRQVRFQHQMTAEQFATRLGVTRNQIVGIERGRTPLSLLIARKIEDTFDINLAWLANEIGAMKPRLSHSWKYNDPAPAGMRFAEFFEAALAAKVDAIHRGIMRQIYSRLIGEDDRRLTDDQIGERILGELQGALDRMPHASKTLLLYDLVRIFERHSQNHDSPNSQVTLDITTMKADKGNVQTKIRTLDELIVRLRKLTKPRGTKAALAREFSVSRQAVDQWLSGDSSPSAEIALRLLDWVEQHGKK